MYFLHFIIIFIITLSIKSVSRIKLILIEFINKFAQEIINMLRKHFNSYKITFSYSNCNGFI